MEVFEIIGVVLLRMAKTLGLEMVANLEKIVWVVIFGPRILKTKLPGASGGKRMWAVGKGSPKGLGW